MPPHPPGPRPGVPAHALAAALADLNARMGGRIQPGRRLAEEVMGTLAVCPTGIPRLDERLGGGFPRGRLSELCGPPSSGRTSLATRLLAGTLARGALAAWIDPGDAFDPASAVEAGIDQAALSRLLWIRARSEREALRSCERILEAEGFELVLLDLVQSATSASARSPARPTASPISDTSWLRLARAAARQQSALIVLSHAPLAGARAELALELRPLRTRFNRPLQLLDALETSAVLLRHRPRAGQRPGEQPIALRLEAPDASGTDASEHGGPEPDLPGKPRPRARA